MMEDAMKHIRFLVVLSALALLTFALLMRAEPTTDGAALPEDKSYGDALIGGDFEMVSHTGEAFTQEQLLGQFSLLYFGFTYCPDICPEGLVTIAQAIDVLPTATAAQLQPIFVSVDSQRDTTEVMRDYVQHFHPKLVGLTGSPEQVDVIARAYKVFHSKVEKEGDEDNYLIDHSGFMYLMDPQGRYLTHFPHHVSAEELAEALLKHIGADAQATASSPIEATQARAFPPIGAGQVSAAYVTLTNTTDEALFVVAASSDAYGRIELHTHALDEEGVLRMREIERIELPAQTPVELKAGGLHLMLYDPQRPIAAGDSVNITLQLEHASGDAVPALALDFPVQSRTSHAISDDAKEGDCCDENQ
jgi:cytochrome oxidase Cu insertion factor (SCO1/SenC/PrrC family)